MAISLSLSSEREINKYIANIERLGCSFGAVTTINPRPILPVLENTFLNITSTLPEVEFCRAQNEAIGYDLISVTVTG